jgi:hypothetical protein
MKEDAVPEVPGKQPKGYFKGVEKDKKAARARQFKRQAKMDDDDPRAYRPAPGDKDAKTKPSKHTKKYQQMFEEKEQLTYDGKTTKHFDMCPLALKAFQKNIDDGASGKQLNAAIQSVDNYLGIEKALVKKGEASEQDYDKMKRAVDVAKNMITKAGLAGHTYHSGHLSAVKDLLTTELKEQYLEEKIKAVQNKADETGISYSILKQVYDRGIAAWRTGHRPGTTPQQWALARINSFATGGKTQTTTDKDLWDKHNKSKKESVEEDFDIDEQISIAQRRKRAQTARRFQKRMQRGANIFSRRRANTSRLQKRARRSARDIVAKRFTGGRAKGTLNISQKAAVEKRLQRMQKPISKIARKQLVIKRRQQGK